MTCPSRVICRIVLSTTREKTENSTSCYIEIYPFCFDLRLFVLFAKTEVRREDCKGDETYPIHIQPSKQSVFGFPLKPTNFRLSDPIKYWCNSRRCFCCSICCVLICLTIQNKVLNCQCFLICLFP